MGWELRDQFATGAKKRAYALLTWLLRRLPEKMRATLWFPLLFLVYVGCSSAAGPPITDESLKEVAASLKMYVDELPQMPRLRGYSIVKGSFIPAKLTIGMYEKYWVGDLLDIHRK